MDASFTLEKSTPRAEKEGRLLMEKQRVLNAARREGFGSHKKERIVHLAQEDTLIASCALGWP